MPLARALRLRVARRLARPWAVPPRLPFGELHDRPDVAHVGQGTYGEPTIETFPGETARVWIGSYVSIARDVLLIPGGGHRTDWVTTSPLRVIYGMPRAWADGHPHSRGDIVIGNDVWLGVGAIVLSGVTIGDGAAVGAGAIVSEDVRPYAVVAGNRAVEVRRRFPDDLVERLLAARWWDRDEAWVREHVGLLCSDRVEDLLRELGA